MTARSVAVLALLVTSAQATPFDEVPTLRAMKDELDRSMQLEMTGFPKPYYLSYSMWELREVDATASFGELVDSNAHPLRTLDMDLRVGDPSFDNSNVAEFERVRSVSLSLDDDYDAVRRDLWLATDRYYKSAVETLERKRAVAKAETKNTEENGAFSKESPSHIVDTSTLPSPERATVEALAKKLSAVFRKNPDVYANTVSVKALHGRQYFVSSEGSASLQPVGYVQVDIAIHSQADDGMPIHDGATWWVRTFDQLPAEAELVARAEALSKELSALRKAPVVTNYAGPILFTDIAAAQVMRALLVDHFSGTPPPKGDSPAARWFSDTELSGKVGQRILPTNVSIVDDPTIAKLGKQVVIGASKFDEEGMPSQKVPLIDGGTFKGFLMSRIPRKGFDHTNGHAFASPFSPLRARPTNLIISGKGLGDAELVRRATALGKEQGLDYVLVVEQLAQRIERDEIDFSMMSGDAKLSPPAIMKRVYKDGHQELVRGGTFGPLPLRALRDIVAIGSTSKIYSYLDAGMPGRFGMMFGGRAASGGFLVSIAAPPFLLRDLEVKKPQGANKQTPIAPRP